MSLGSPHIPVLLNEAIDGLNIKADGIYVDGTFGGGGHSTAILKKLGKQGRLIALDRDPAAVELAKQIQDARFQMVHSSFGKLESVLGKLGVVKVDGVLLDLGVSSPQLNQAARGFSFQDNGPLDMRMDTSQGETAAHWLEAATEARIREVIKNYGEERFAKQIARAIIAARSRGAITTTRQLAEIVAKAVSTREPNQNPATRTFQAIRIYVNQELEELKQALVHCLARLNVGGRLVVISFHSLEDRIVKQFFRAATSPDRYPHKLPIRESEMQPPKFQLIGKLIRASDTEVVTNPRARSAVMRIAERIAA